MPNLIYPFDPTGTVPGNLVTGEQHVLTSSNSRDYYVLIPDFSPFFTTNLKVRLTTNGQTRLLVEDVDFSLALPYVAATRAIGQVVYGGISLFGTQINGIVTLEYQTLGGDWTADRTLVLENLAEKVYNPKTTVWDLITDKQDLFPPVNHSLDIAEIYGQQELVGAILQLATTIANADRMALQVHKLDIENPHKVTKAQVGLSLLENLALATDAEVMAMAKVSKYITLKQLVELLQSYSIGSGTSDPSYLLTSASVVNEGGDLLVSITTQNVPDGKVVYWKLDHTETNAADFQNTQGMAVIQNGVGEFLIRALDDVWWETPETFKVQLFEDGYNGVLVTFSPMITLLNNASGATYSLAPSVNTLSEGASMNMGVTATRVQDGTVMYWTILHGNTTSANFTTNSGTVVITGNAGSFQIQSVSNAFLEQDRSFRVELRTGSVTGPVVSTSTPVIITDLNAVATYTATAASNSVNEGSSVTVNVGGTNIANGTVLYWTVNHVGTSASDFVATQGTVTVNNNAGSYNVVTINNPLFTTDKTFTVSLRKTGYNGSVVATTGTITVRNTTVLTYGLTTDVDTVAEGGDIVGLVNTAGVADGTVLYWTISHIGTASVDFNTSSGSVAVVANSASFRITALTDFLSETNETFLLELRTGNVSGPVVAQTTVKTLSNVNAASTYTVTPALTEVNEGSSLAFNVSGYSSPHLSTLYWEVVHDTTTAGDFVTTYGTINMGADDTGSFIIDTVNNPVFTGDKAFSVKVYKDSTKVYMYAASATVTVRDVTVPGYAIVATPTAASEGETVAVQVSTQNLPNNTVLYWTVLHGTTSADDLDKVSGSVVVNNNTASFTLSVLNDQIWESSETFQIQLRTLSASGAVVAITDYVTVSEGYMNLYTSCCLYDPSVEVNAMSLYLLGRE